MKIWHLRLVYRPATVASYASCISVYYEKAQVQLFFYMTVANNVIPIKPNTKIKPGAEYVAGSPYGVDMPRVLGQYDDTSLRTGLGNISHVIIEEMLTDPDVFAGLMLIALMAMNEDMMITPAVTESALQVNQKDEITAPPDTLNTGLPAAPANKKPQDSTTQQNKDNIPATDAPNDADDTAPMPVAASLATDPRVERAKEIADFCQRQYDRVPKIAATLFQLCFEGMAHGNKVAEQVLEIAPRGTDKGKWCLKALKPKPREAIAFVVDTYMNELGMLGALPGQSSVIQTSMVADMSDVIPREKFAVFTYRPKDNDPRGQSALNAALNGWDMKRRTFPEYLLFLMVSAIPGILATVAAGQDEITLYEDDGVTERKDENGEAITIQAHQFLLNMLSKMRNHQVGVAPEGTEFTLLEANSEGEVFTRALDKFGSEITMAILFQQLATRDSTHQTKGATGSQARVIDQIVWWVRDTIADMVRYDIFKPLVRYNFGDEDADELLPKTSLGDTEARDWSQDAQAVKALADICTESQLDHLFTQIGIPLPTEAERAFKRMAKQLAQESQKKGLQDDGDTTGDEEEDTAPGGNATGKAGKKAPATIKEGNK